MRHGQRREYRSEYRIRLEMSQRYRKIPYDMIGQTFNKRLDLYSFQPLNSFTLNPHNHCNNPKADIIC